MDKNLQSNFNINYKLNGKYDGFAFDLDGTLFNEEGNVEKNILNKLKEYYKLQLPIIFVTGRGPGTTDKLILENSLNRYSDIYIVNYNGGLVRKIYKGNSKIEILKEIKNKKGNLNFFVNNTNLKDKLVTKESGEAFFTKERDYMLTLVFKKSEFKKGKLDFGLVKQVEKIINENNLKYKILYTGHTIDLIPLESGKENAVKIVENLLGVKKLARVGDKGNEYGNDYDMISYGNGFTVSEGKTAIPILDNNGQKLRDQEAIKRIFEILDFNSGTKKEGKNIGEKELYEYKEVGKNVRKNFLKESIKSGVENIFSFDGSIMFTKKEFSVLEEKNPLFLKYLVKYGGYYYSRNNYFHLLEENFEKKYKLFFDNFYQIKRDFYLIINNLDEKNDFNRKILLSIIDLFKSYIIRYLHYISYIQTVFYIDLNNVLSKVKDNLKIIEELYIGVLENKYDKQDFWKLDFEISDFKEKLDKNIKYSEIFKKSIREIPEANHPYFNYIYSKKVARKVLDEYQNEKEINLIGLHYGGTELPYLLEVELRKKGFKGKINKIGVHYSNYSNKMLNLVSNIFDENINMKGKVCIIQDDGGFTGNSLFKIGDILLKNGARKVEYSTVHFSGDRARYFLENNGGLKFNFLEYLQQWGVVRVGPFFKEGKKFNIEKERVKRIIK